ncbi:amino acid permease [Sphingomonas sp. CGMCC 1.13654]|uniref:Arginine/agmatine antiporter n=1 Tax=Sphingomonas chungangi TaxID=2683589 RepID=A0A838L2G9_9SPHN|nr:amino acid permease [Sphingomonas chungangi]MBA2933257.1 amino acid permease [Sphingomonas chungangi]MVW57927.1 amino acid permease [Sphingomonas chungangi]
MGAEAGGDEPSDAVNHGRLGVGMCIALVIGNMVGSGVFLLPGPLAPLGWNSVYGWLLTIGGSLCVAYVLARLARDMAGGCGPVTYAHAAFGPAAGFTIGWSYWISVWVANATLAVGAVSNLSILFPRLASAPGLPAVAAVVPIWVLTLINCLGVRRAGGVQSITTILKLVPLAGAILVGAWLLLSGRATLPAASVQPVTTGAIGMAATLTLFPLLGFESALVAGDRIENPKRTIPRATLYGTAITGLIYLFACSAVTLLLPEKAVTQSNAPFALFFGTFVHPALAPVIALFVVIAALGALNGYVLLQGELLLSLARERMLPAWFDRENRFGTPQRAHIVSSTLASAVVLANYTRGLADLFEFMVLVTTSVSIIFYLAGMLASFRLLRVGRIAPSRGFEAIAVVGFVYSAWTFYGAGIEASVWSLAMTAAGLPIYLFMRLSRSAAVPELQPGG